MKARKDTCIVNLTDFWYESKSSVPAKGDKGYVVVYLIAKR